MTIANSLDPAQARQNVGPDLDLTCLTLGWYSRKYFSKKLILKQISRRQKVIRLPSIQTCAILRLKGQDYRNYKELQYIYSCPMKTRHSTHALSYGLSICLLYAFFLTFFLILKPVLVFNPEKLRERLP